MTNAHQQDVYALFTALEGTHEALRALGELVVAAAETGNSLGYISFGLSVLFQQQCDDVRDNTAELRGIFNNGPQVVETPRKLDINDPDDAAIMESHREMIAEMHALRHDREALRKEVLTEMMLDQNGVIARLETVDAGDLAERANVDKEAVERVLGRLLADATRPELPASTKRARR